MDEIDLGTEVEAELDLELAEGPAQRPKARLGLRTRVGELAELGGMRRHDHLANAVALSQTPHLKCFLQAAGAVVESRGGVGGGIYHKGSSSSIGVAKA